MKKKNGITRDIEFATTEYNYKTYNSDWPDKAKQLVTEDFAAIRLLTAVCSLFELVAYILTGKSSQCWPIEKKE